MSFFSLKLFAQAPNNTFIYEHDPSLWYQSSDATVNEKFIASSGYPKDGFAQFQPLKNTSSNIVIMQVSITDDLGNVVRNDIYRLPNGEDMVPNACSYNSEIKQYYSYWCITKFFRK